MLADTAHDLALRARRTARDGTVSQINLALQHARVPALPVPRAASAPRLRTRSAGAAPSVLRLIGAVRFCRIQRDDAHVGRAEIAFPRAIFIGAALPLFARFAGHLGERQRIAPAEGKKIEAEQSGKEAQEATAKGQGAR